MSNLDDNQIKEGKGKLLYKSKRPWKKKSSIIYALSDLVFILGIIFSIYYLILNTTYFPESILLVFALGLGTFLCGFIS